MMRALRTFSDEDFELDVNKQRVHCFYDIIQRASRPILAMFDTVDDEGQPTGILSRLRRIIRSIRSASGRTQWKKSLDSYKEFAQAENSNLDSASHVIISEGESIPVLEIGQRVEAAYDMLERVLNLAEVSRHCMLVQC